MFGISDGVFSHHVMYAINNIEIVKINLQNSQVILHFFHLSNVDVFVSECNIMKLPGCWKVLIPTCVNVLDFSAVYCYYDFI